MSQKKRAVIDIGTNSVRLMIFLDSKDSLKVLKRKIKVTRLGEGFSDKNSLLPQAVQRTAEAVAEMHLCARRYGADLTAVVATSAVREADNRAYFTDKLKRDTGLTVTVISGEQEALLSHRGVAVSIDIPASSLVVFDMGGGSTEVVWSDGCTLKAKSYPVGVVKLEEKFNLGLSSDPLKVRAVEAFLDDTLYDLPQIAESQHLAGVGGTVTSLAAIDQKMVKYNPQLIHGTVLAKERIVFLKELLLSTTLKERRCLPGLMPERADVIIAGVIMTAFLLKKFQADIFSVSEGDLMLGLVAGENQKILIGNE